VYLLQAEGGAQVHGAVQEPESQDLFPSQPSVGSDTMSDSESLSASAVTPSGPSQGGSLYVPTQEKSTTQRQALDEFLLACGANPTDKVLKVGWRSCSERTRHDYINKLEEIFDCVASVLAGGEGADLLKAAFCDRILQHHSDELLEEDLLEALTEAYKNCDGWATRRQILSIIADQYTFLQIKDRLPNMTQYQVTAARQHISSHGRGVLAVKEPITRCRVSPAQIQHFISFVCSPHVMQDLPFGEKHLKLSNGDLVKVPKVVLTMIPERLISQYLTFCQETSFTPTGARTLRRVLHACATTYR